MYIAHEFTVRKLAIQTRLSSLKSVFQAWFPKSRLTESFQEYYTLKRLIRGGKRIQGGIPVDRRLPLTYDILSQFYATLHPPFSL